MRIHSTESFGSVDGPGIRFVIFAQGCPMRCAYCHNPDTWNSSEGHEVATSALLDKAERYRPYWGAEGGITVSGGEPLWQIDSLIELFEEARRRSIGTCLDTSAQPYSTDPSWQEKWQRLMALTDTVLLDLKHIDPEQHRLLTGFDNHNILDCARDLARRPNVRLWIRHVLVPGITDDDQQLRQLAQFIASLGRVERIDVLPYHSMGAYKYERLGLPYRLATTAPRTPRRLATAELDMKNRAE